MLKNLVEETANNPGTSTTVTLGGAPAGRQTWRGAGFANNAPVFYFITDGTIGEWGIGTMVLSTSDSITRDTVIGNTSGTTSRLNFTGTCRVYNALPGERAIYSGAGSVLLSGDVNVTKAQPQLILDKTASGQGSVLVGKRLGTYRWQLQLGNATVETGSSNVGSDFSLDRYSDVGVYIDTPMTVSRATGALSVASGGISTTGNITATGAISATGAIGTSSTLNATAGISTGGLVTAGSATVGKVSLLPGTSDSPGLIGFYNTDGTRSGFIGYKVAATSRLYVYAESGWSWNFTGTAYFTSELVTENSAVSVRGTSQNRTINFQETDGAERAVFWNKYTDGSQNLRVGGSASTAVWQWSSGGKLTLPPVASNAATSDTSSSLEVKNNGGSGDTNVAALSFTATSYTTKLHLRADGLFGLGGASAAAWRWYVNAATGDMTAAGNVTAYSDPRLKDNVRRIDGALDILNELDGVRFTWNDRSSLIACPGKQDIGILADQVEKVLPELVSLSVEDTTTQEKYRTVAYDKLVPVLIEAIKTLDARVKELEGRA